ncbi:MAG: Nif3-like dinuclear metal center hexameric protein [Thaumarchaeota archaeon]|nr:Nif3-like dinuclear metal center hexameric protein [Nitrososphaerota archaeon]
MDTSGIMRLALDRAGFDKVPADSGIWFPGKKIKRALFSIDAATPEIILAKEMRYDLLIAHHPVGPARIAFSEVVRRHLDFMIEKGVPRRVAEEAVGELVSRVDVRAHPTNYLHEVDVAKKLSLPFMNIHLPIDQITRDYLLGAIDGAESKTVGDLTRKLSKITEFAKAKTKIELRMGEQDNPLGKWVLLFAAGTNGGYPVAKAYFEHGIDTVIYLHIDYDELVRLRKDCRGNLIVLGHMAGDSIGINIFLRDLLSKGVHSDTIGVVR